MLPLSKQNRWFDVFYDNITETFEFDDFVKPYRVHSNDVLYSDFTMTWNWKCAIESLIKPAMHASQLASFIKQRTGKEVKIPTPFTMTKLLDSFTYIVVDLYKDTDKWKDRFFYCDQSKWDRERVCVMNVLSPCELRITSPKNPRP